METEPIKQRTESERILSSFDDKLEILDKFSLQISQQVTNAVGFDLRPQGETIKDGQQDNNNFISELDNRLSRLQKLIEQFEEIQYNLSRLV
jgi:hypothetical protein